MSGFTAEDFARANLATRGEFEVARRVDPDDVLAWRACYDDGREVFPTDEHMAREGWTPVVESQVTERTLRDSQEKAARKRERLVDHIADQDRVIRRRNDEITALRERVRVAESGRLSLDRLAAVWEAAEVLPDSGLSAGDLCIERCADDHYEVFRAEIDAEVDGVSRSTIRILSRAPRREPWQDLADVMLEDHLVFEEDAEGIAKRLHERGVRVTGGDE